MTQDDDTLPTAAPTDAPPKPARRPRRKVATEAIEAIEADAAPEAAPAPGAAPASEPIAAEQPATAAKAATVSDAPEPAELPAPRRRRSPRAAKGGEPVLEPTPAVSEAVKPADHGPFEPLEHMLGAGHGRGQHRHGGRCWRLLAKPRHIRRPVRGPPWNRLCRATGGAPLRGRRRRRFGGEPSSRTP